MARQEMPISSPNEFAAYVRSKPADAVTYGSCGTGLGGHLHMEALAYQAGLKFRHAPYKAAPSAIAALPGGHFKASFAVATTAVPHIKSSKLKALAISRPYRSPSAPEVRTMTLQGVKMDLVAWYGLFAPAGNPQRSCKPSAAK